MDVFVHHAVAHQQMPPEAFSKIDGGASVIGQAVGKRLVQDGGGIAVIVMAPVRYRPQTGSRLENIGLREKGHQGDKSPIGASIDTYALRVYSFMFHQVFHTIYLVAEVFST